MISDEYLNLGFNELYYLVHIDNLASIFKFGLLSKNEIISKNLYYTDISNKNVQIRRDSKPIGGYQLHDYVNLFFYPRNSMLYELQSNYLITEICILVLNIDVLNKNDVFVSDGNCASENTNIYKCSDGYTKIIKDGIFNRYWVRQDRTIDYEKRRKTSAEVLVLNNIKSKYIDYIIVKNEATKQKILDLNLNVEIIINPDIFF